jgi:hypothetical protein
MNNKLAWDTLTVVTDTGLNSVFQLSTSPVSATTYPLQHIMASTYDHRFKNIALPVRSAVLKLVTGRLVVRWVTTGEYLLLYVFVFADNLRARCLSMKFLRS